MIKEGEEVRIVYSHKLAEMKLTMLASQRGVVTKIAHNHKNPGAFISIRNGKNCGEEWFVPLMSIQANDYLKRVRNLGLIKSTII